MAQLTCICGYYMSNNMDIVYFEYDCLSDEVFNENVKTIKNVVDKYVYLFPDESPKIWRCPKCKTIYWFEFQNDTGPVFLLKNTIPLKNYSGLYECECGHHFNQFELIHCYSDEQRISIINKIDEAVERNLPTEFEDSTVHIWKCPDCNRLYWIDRKSGIVERYERRTQ